MQKEQKNNALKIIKSTGISSVKTIFSMLLVILLFAIVNIVIFIYSLNNGFENNKALYTFLVVIIGFSFTFFAAYKMYRYNLLKGFSSVYKHISPFFEKVSEFVVDKSEDLLNGKTNLKNKKNSKSIDVKKLLNENFDKVPGFLKLGMTFIINRIPFVEMLSELKEEMDEDDNTLVSNKLHGKMDGYIVDSIFGSNTKNWIYWLLPLNVIIQLSFIYLK